MIKEIKVPIELSVTGTTIYVYINGSEVGIEFDLEQILTDFVNDADESIDDLDNMVQMSLMFDRVGSILKEKIEQEA